MRMMLLRHSCARVLYFYLEPGTQSGDDPTQPRVQKGYFMKTFWLTFIPLFVAVDAMGVLPMYIGLTEGIDAKRNRTIVMQSVLAAAIAGVVFLLVGRWILAMLNISFSDFMVAGGIILFLLAITDIISLDKPGRRIHSDDVGPVPVGIPLIVGPGVLTTGMLLIQQYGLWLTMASLALNIFIAGFIFWWAPHISELFGKNGSKVISKLAALLLASYAVMIVRKGIMGFVSQ
jgi:multiple antibiotic resistance protein